METLVNRAFPALLKNKLKTITMKKSETNQEKVLSTLGKFSSSTVEILSTGTGINKLLLYKILKPLVENKQVVKSETTPPTYSLAVGKNDRTKTNPKNIADDELQLPNATGRDTSKLKFNGELYGKGRLVLAVVQHYVKSNPRVSLTKLKEVFPDELQPRYGMVQEVGKAKKLSADRDRFFLKPEDLIKVGDKKIAVCNQFGSNNLPPFLKMVKSRLGYNIK
jgi:hypothetical protein